MNCSSNLKNNPSQNPIKNYKEKLYKSTKPGEHMASLERDTCVAILESMASALDEMAAALRTTAQLIRLAGREEETDIKK